MITLAPPHLVDRVPHRVERLEAEDAVEEAAEARGDLGEVVELLAVGQAGQVDGGERLDDELHIEEELDEVGGVGREEDHDRHRHEFDHLI